MYCTLIYTVTWIDQISIFIWEGHTSSVEIHASSYPVLNQAKHKPQWQNTKCHIPLTRNSSGAGCALRLSFLFVSVGFFLKTLAAVPKNYGTPLEKYSSDSRRHCSICVGNCALFRPRWHWRTTLLYHRSFSLSPVKSWGLIQDNLSPTQVKRTDRKDGKKHGQLGWLEQWQNEGDC